MDLDDLLQLAMSAVDLGDAALAKVYIHKIARQIRVHTDEPRYDAASKADAANP
jgi:hypothetical protein